MPVYPPTLRVHLKDQQRAYLMMLMRCFCACVCFFPDFFFYKSIYCGYPYELHRQVDAIQMGTHNICHYDKSTLAEIKDYRITLIGVCVVIRSNTVHITVFIIKIHPQ